ncbi:MAG: Uma2 family endonuclease [Myxococcota bacterium]
MATVSPALDPPLVSEAEFLNLPESMERVELLDGEVIVAPPPTDRHQAVLGRLHFALFGWAEAHPPAAVRLAPLDVRFGPGRILQPDLFVVLGGLPTGAATPLEVVPDVVVEVLSARRSYDRLTKRAVYAEAGVPEYWVVDSVQRLVEVHGVAHRIVHDVLTTPRLPGFSLPLGPQF